jgi:hypothetical protein
MYLSFIEVCIQIDKKQTSLANKSFAHGAHLGFFFLFIFTPVFCFPIFYPDCTSSPCRRPPARRFSHKIALRNATPALARPHASHSPQTIVATADGEGNKLLDAASLLHYLFETSKVALTTQGHHRLQWFKLFIIPIVDVFFGIR